MALNRHSIQSRVLLLQGAGWVVSLALIGATGWLTVSEVRRQTAAHRGQMARVAASHVDHAVAGDLARVQRLSGATVFSPADPPALRGALRQIYQSTTVVDAVTIVAADGSPLAHEPGGRQPASIGEDEVRVVLAHARPEVRAAAGHAAVDVVVPLRDRLGGEGAVAVVRIAPDVRALRDLLSLAGASLVAPAAGDPDDVRVPLTLLPWEVVLRAEPPETEATLAAIRNALLWIAPVLVALGALFAWGTAWSVRQPVLMLTAAAERMRSGDLATPLPVLADDEVGRLGAGLEHLRRALDTSLQTIARHNQELEQRVADRTRELENACRQLSDRDRWRAHVLRQVISAQEDERRRLARELHDDTCQSLAALALSADAAVAGLAAGPARDRLQSVKVLVDRSLADLHRVIHDLRPSILDDLGLVPAIHWLAAEHTRRTGVVARLEVDGVDDRLPQEVETALFRVVQEALNNIARHAAADSVLVQMAVDRGLLVVEVEDDGKGFEPEAVAGERESGRGLGLLGMRERVELLGGSCHVDSTPGAGTRVVVTVPYVPRLTEAGA